MSSYNLDISYVLNEDCEFTSADFWGVERVLKNITIVWYEASANLLRLDLTGKMGSSMFNSARGEGIIYTSILNLDYTYYKKKSYIGQK